MALRAAWPVAAAPPTPPLHSALASPLHIWSPVGGEGGLGSVLLVSACITRLKSIFKAIRKSATKLVQGRSSNSIRQGRVA